MPHTTTTSTGRRGGVAALKRDPWDDDALDAEEAGPSWTKTYVGGLKLRQYTALDAFPAWASSHLVAA